MNSFWNKFIQTSVTITQVVNITAPIVPDKYKPVAAGVLGILQGITAIVAHNYNPDGTPAKVAYQPKGN